MRGFDPLRWALFLLVVLTISRINGVFAPLAALRLPLVLAGFAVVFGFLNPRYLSRLSWIRTTPARVVAGIAVMACLSGLLGLYPGGSVQYIQHNFSKVLILSFMLMATIRTPRDLRFYAWAFVIASGLLVWQALFVYRTSQTSAGLERLGGLSMYDANDLGVVLLVGLGLTLVTLQVSGRLGRTVSMVILCGIGASLARSGSRGAFLGLIAFGLGLLTLVRGLPLWKRVVPPVAVLVVLVLASPEGYWEQMGTILQPTQDYNWTEAGGRRALTERGIGYMMRYPLSGVGVGQFGLAEGTISEIAMNRQPGTGVRWTAPHNTYLQAGAEMGIPGLVLFCALVFGGGLAAWRVSRRLPKAWKRGTPDQRTLYFFSQYAVTAYCGFAVSCFFVSFAYVDTIYVLSALLGGFLAIMRSSGGLPDAGAGSGLGGASARPLDRGSHWVRR